MAYTTPDPSWIEYCAFKTPTGTVDGDDAYGTPALTVDENDATYYGGYSGLGVVAYGSVTVKIDSASPVIWGTPVTINIINMKLSCAAGGIGGGTRQWYVKLQQDEVWIGTLINTFIGAGSTTEYWDTDDGSNGPYENITGIDAGVFGTGIGSPLNPGGTGLGYIYTLEAWGGSAFKPRVMMVI